MANPCGLPDAVPLIEFLERVVRDGPTIDVTLQEGAELGVASNSQDVLSELIGTAQMLLDTLKA